MWISMIILKYVWLTQGEGGNLALQLPVLHWMFKGTHQHITQPVLQVSSLDYTKSLTRETQLPRNSRRRYGLARSRDFGALPEKVIPSQNAPLCTELSEDERAYAVFTDWSCCGRKPLEVESWRWVKPICRTVSHLTGPRDCWRRRVACNLYWLLDGG